MDTFAAKAQTVVTEDMALDRILEAYGHIQPPKGSFTVETYITRAENRGCILSRRTAERTLAQEYYAGRLRRRKYMIDGYTRFVYWKEAEHEMSEGQEEGDNALRVVSG